MTQAEAVRQPKRRFAWERSLRLWSGMVLMAFVTTHLANHALGIFGVAVLNRVQDWRWDVWHEVPGVYVLGGSFLVHFALGLKKIAARRTWRMPAQEAVQIVLGLLIPLLLAGHFAGTRLLNDFYGAHEFYDEILARLWPQGALTQTLLVIVVWTHGALGLNFAAKAKPWWPRWKGLALAVSVLIPVLALAGFVSAGRAVAVQVPQPAALTAEQIAGLELITGRLHQSLMVLGLGLIAAIGWQGLKIWRGRRITVRFLGHGERRAAPGVSVLETSRANNIPHPSLCGGRARCSTCRVMVTAGLDTLPAPVGAEHALLERIAAPAGVRLACQIRPEHDISVQILLPAIGKDYRTAQAHAMRAGATRDAAILFVDIRAFNTLSQKQLPHELIALLNRFIAEMSQAVEAHDGEVDLLLSDGLMAAFGLNSTREKACRAAIFTARDMMRAVRALNQELASALPMPVRIGIGIHVGPVIVAENQSGSGATLSALGETVSIAARLEAATKEVLADCLISAEAAAAAGALFPEASRREIQIRGRAKPLAAFALSEADEALSVPTRTSRAPAEAQSEPST